MQVIRLYHATLQTIFSEGTSLGDVYQGLAGGKLRNGVDEWLADQTSEPSHWALPGITHADGYEAYQVSQLSVNQQFRFISFSFHLYL